MNGVYKCFFSQIYNGLLNIYPKYFKYALLFFILQSCKEKSCEAFNFKKLPYNKFHYLKKLTYTDGKDTISYFPRIVECSKKSKINSISNPVCNPFLAIEYKNKLDHTDYFLFDFSYYRNRKGIFLSIDTHKFDLNIEIDSLLKSKIIKNESIKFEIKDDNFNIDSTERIRSIEFQKMRITRIETYQGTVWKLIEI